MRLTYLTTLTSLIFVAALFTSCGGSTMSAGGNNLIKKRERKEGASGSNDDAKDPKVVTGAYLSCEPSPKDAGGSGSDAVGCSMRSASGGKIQANSENKIKYYKSLNSGPYTAPSKQNTASGHTALFDLPKSEIPNTRFIVTYKNKSGMDELVCDGANLPCRKTANMEQSPMYLTMPVAGLFPVDNNKLTTHFTKAWDALESDYFCSGGNPKIGSEPTKNGMGDKIPIFGGIVANAIDLFGGGYSRVRALPAFSMSAKEFCALKKPTGGYSTYGDGCYLALMRKLGKSASLDHMNARTSEIKNDLFVVIMNDTTLTDEALESTLSEFKCP